MIPACDQRLASGEMTRAMRPMTEPTLDLIVQRAMLSNDVAYEVLPCDPMSGSQGSTSYATSLLSIARWTIRSRVGSVIGRIALVISPEGVSGHMPESCPNKIPTFRRFALRLG